MAHFRVCVQLEGENVSAHHASASSQWDSSILLFLPLPCFILRSHSVCAGASPDGWRSAWRTLTWLLSSSEVDVDVDAGGVFRFNHFSIHLYRGSEYPISVSPCAAVPMPWTNKTPMGFLSAISHILSALLSVDSYPAVTLNLLLISQILSFSQLKLYLLP